MHRAYGLAIWRFFLIILVFFTYTPVYWLLLKINQPLGFRFGRFYLSSWRKCIGHQLIIKGALSEAKPTLFVSNHSSYIDILVLGTFIPARFVAKLEVAKWPIMGWLATNQGTIYIDRSRNAISEGTDKLMEFIDKGESLILFPEGTTSDGCRILPFGSSFFDVAIKKNMIVQPITVTYAGWDGLPMPRMMRKICGWFSPDVDLLSHLWSIAQWGTVQVIVSLHAPMKASDFASRKELSQASFHAVQDGLIGAFSKPISTYTS
ncbi:MAG TPA: lysophospholipid acyltransferase family protein [Alphaproteobacteria bacterium]|nr:lysophospholipid acyltransferase family protein [Alphaproteobacteria bacterium]